MKVTYFLQAKTMRHIKIGRTEVMVPDGTEQEIDRIDAATARMKACQTGSPDRLRLLGVTDVHTERELHIRFRQDRIIGEWFKPVPSLCNLIERDCRPLVSKPNWVPVKRRQVITMDEYEERRRRAKAAACYWERRFRRAVDFYYRMARCTP